MCWSPRNIVKVHFCTVFLQYVKEEWLPMKVYYVSLLSNIKMSIEQQGMILAWKNWSTQWETPPSATFPGTDLHWLAQDWTEAVRQMNNCLSHGTAICCMKIVWMIYRLSVCTVQITHWPYNATASHFLLFIANHFLLFREIISLLWQSYETLKYIVWAKCRVFVC